MYSKLLLSSHCVGEIATRLNGAKDFNTGSQARYGSPVRAFARQADHSGLSEPHGIKEINIPHRAPTKCLHPICPSCAARAVVEITSKSKEDYFVCKAPKQCNCPVCKYNNLRSVTGSRNTVCLAPEPCCCPMCMTKLMTSGDKAQPDPTQHCKAPKPCDCSMCTNQKTNEQNECKSACKAPNPCCCPLCMTKLMTKKISKPEKDPNCRAPQLCYCSLCMKKLLETTSSTGTVVKEDECKLPNPCCCPECMARRRKTVRPVQTTVVEKKEENYFCRAPLPCCCPQCVENLKKKSGESLQPDYSNIQRERQQVMPRCQAYANAEQHAYPSASKLPALRCNCALCSRINQFQIPKEVPDIFSIRQYCTSKEPRKCCCPICTMRNYRTSSDIVLSKRNDRYMTSKSCNCPTCIASRQQESQFHEFNQRYNYNTVSQCFCPHCTACRSQRNPSCSCGRNYNSWQFPKFTCYHCMTMSDAEGGQKGYPLRGHGCRSCRRCQSQAAICPRTYIPLKQYNYHPYAAAVQIYPKPAGETETKTEGTSSAPSRITQSPVSTVTLRSYSTSAKNLQFFVPLLRAPKLYRSILLMGDRGYSLCCPPRPKPGQCGCENVVPGGGRRIVPPSDCRPGPVSYNPCRPQFHSPHGGDTYKKYRNLFFFVCLPAIIIQYFRTTCLVIPPKEECREYEYMRRRTKRFPWGDGTKSFFHNDHINHLPDECVPEEPDYCD